MFRAPLCPSSRAQELYRWLLPVVHGALVYKSLVWCGAEGCVCGLRVGDGHNGARNMLSKQQDLQKKKSSVAFSWHFSSTSNKRVLYMSLRTPLLWILIFKNLRTPTPFIITNAYDGIFLYIPEPSCTPGRY